MPERSQEAAKPTDEDIAAAIREAAAYIGRHGWCQVDFERRDGSVCALGAVIKVCHHRETDPLAVQRYLNSYLDGNSFMCWNDGPERTMDEVIAAMLDAANKLVDPPKLGFIAQLLRRITLVLGDDK